LLCLQPYDQTVLEFLIVDPIGRLNMLKDLIPLISQAHTASSLSEIRAAIGDPTAYSDVSCIVATLASIQDNVDSMKEHMGYMHT
jgi:hypothetical protein